MPAAVTWARAVMMLVATLFSGCGHQLATVSGMVRFNGEPVPHGVVSLLPADTKGTAAGGVIESGSYRVERVQPGEKVVQLAAPVSVGIRKDDYGNDTQTFEDLMPASWGRASQHRITVTAGAVTQDFTIEGPDPRKKK